MGNFYVNITMHGPDQNDVAGKIRELHRKAFISPTVDGYTTVYEAECEEQNEGIIKKLSQDLSAHFSCPAWAVLNHDDDILAYWLYDGGKLVDEYDSAPDYFNRDAGEDDIRGPLGGNAQSLIGLMGRSGKTEAVEEILRKSNAYVFGLDRQDDLVRVLGMPTFMVGFGYKYLSNGELPEGLTEGDLIEV